MNAGMAYLKHNQREALFRVGHDADKKKESPDGWPLRDRYAALDCSGTRLWPGDRFIPIYQ